MISVRFTLQEDQVIIGQPTVMTLCEEPFRETVAQLATAGIQLTDFDVTKLTGTVMAAEDGVLFTSIPYDSGWSVKIDGVPVETFAYHDTWLMTKLSAGAHTVELNYLPQGYSVGLVISICSAAVLLLLLVKRLQKVRFR